MGSRVRRGCDGIESPCVSERESLSFGGPEANNAPKSTYSFCQILALILALTRDPREMAMLVKRACGRSSDAEKVRDDLRVPSAETPVIAVTSSSTTRSFGWTMDVEETEGNLIALLERGVTKAAFTASVTAIEMVVARASTLRCIRPESLLATGAPDVAVASCAGITSGSSEGRNRFERQEFVGELRLLGGITGGKISYRKIN